MKVEYLYDDRGFRLAKLDFPNYRTTWYIRDASGNVISIYEETGVSAATRDEGGIHPPQPPAWVIQTEIPVYGAGKLGLYYPQQDASMSYEITDHLGNVRALLRDNISIYTATMEDNGLEGDNNPRNEEKAYFQNIEETVVTDSRMNHTEATPYGTPDKAAYLFWNDTQGTLAEEKAIGPAIALRVQAGDKLEIETWSRFERKNDYTHDFGLVALSALLGNTFSASGGFEGFTINNTISSLEGALTAGAFPDDGGDDTRPFAYLNYIIYDEDMVYQNAGWRRVTDDAGFYPEEIGLPEKTPVRVAFEQPITINESGYIYVWVSNQSKETRVWFDDLQFTHTQNIVVQATDYGAWGDVLREQKTDESAYRFVYQGQFAEKDEETGWNHFELREYDPIIGRWLVPDPLGEFWSPYLAMRNSPINFTDPNGGNTGPVLFAQGDCKCSYVDVDGNRISEFDNALDLSMLRYYAGIDFAILWDEINISSERMKKEYLDPLYAKSWSQFRKELSEIIPVLGQGSLKTLEELQADEYSPSNEQLVAGVAPVFLTRNAAFRYAKRINKIPMSAKPISIFKVRDKNTGKLLEVHRFRNNDGKLIDIRKDNPITYPDGGYQGPHFNAGEAGGKLSQHFYYED